MIEKIRVLYAEDDLSDLDLTKTHFRLKAPDCELEVVDTVSYQTVRRVLKKTTSSRT